MNFESRKRGRPRKEEGGSSSTVKRRLLEEALQFTKDKDDAVNAEPVDSVERGEPGSDELQTERSDQGDLPDVPSDLGSTNQVGSGLGRVSDTFVFGSELGSVGDIGSTCGLGSEIYSVTGEAALGSEVNSVTGEASSEADSIMSKPATIPSTPLKSLDEMAELSFMSSQCTEWYDPLLTGSLIYDCDMCLQCRCIACTVCFHDEGGLCVHCEDCLSDNLSDCSDSDSFLTCFEDLDALPDEYEAIVSEDDARNASIKQDLVDIAIKHHLTHAALHDILLFCRKYQFGDMPKCASTLLKTSRTIVTREVKPGEYWHNGLTKLLLEYLDQTNCSDVEVEFSVDGIPVAKSSNTSFWAIPVSFNGSREVHLVGCYCGPSKPDDANDFLRDFVDEIKVLCAEGLSHCGRNVNVTCVRGIFDAPAKSFSCNTKGCNACHGCPRCTVEGEMMNRRMTFLQCDAPLRTDEGFLRKDDEEYHKGDTILEQIPFFLLVSQIPFDYLHLILLGVMRKLLYMWIQGPYAVRLGAKNVIAISEQLIELNAWVPKDFVRGLRSLQYVKRFKASEFRKLLLYVLPVVLRKNFPHKLYEHFLVLHVAVTIMIDPNLCTKYLQSAKEYCLFFVETFKNLYGFEYVSHNVHALIHIADDVERHGPLDHFSSFKYENFYQYLIRIIHKGRKPLQQLASRYSEFERIKSTKSQSRSCNLEFSRLHCDGPLLSECQGPQFKSCMLPDECEVTFSQADNCVFMDGGEIVLVNNFAHSSAGEKIVIGREFLDVDDLYKLPCESSALDIYEATDLSELKVWPASSISRKCYRMPLGDNVFAIYPLRHSGKQ